MIRPKKKTFWLHFLLRSKMVGDSRIPVFPAVFIMNVIFLLCCEITPNRWINIEFGLATHVPVGMDGVNFNGPWTIFFFILIIGSFYQTN